MKDDKKRSILIIIILVILLGGMIFFLFVNRGNQDPAKITNKVHMVTDHSRFFTVVSCVSSFISYQSSQDTNNLLLLLNDNYKNNNHITASNLYQYIGTLESDYEFSANRMYQEQVNDDVMKYYVSGVLNPAMMYDDPEDLYHAPQKKYDVIVYLNLRQSTFSIEPYDGSIFEGGAS